MKRLLLVLSVIVAGFTLSNVNAQTTAPVKKWGQLQVIGTQLCDQQGNPVVLRGISLGWHNLWPRFYNKKAVKTLHQDWHANVVRAAMGIMIEDNYLENPEYAMQCMTPVIESAIKNDVYVIIDWHSHKLLTAEATKFFGEMAKKYGKHPHVIYELYNEPVEDSWDDLKAYAQTVIKEIRKHDPDNIILMGCPHWDQDVHIVAESPITGVTNVMYTLHYYAATHKDYLRDRMREAAKRIPIFVSESGVCEASGDGEINEEETQKWIDLMEELKISWVFWSVSDKNESCSMLLPRATPGGPWSDDVIKRSGRIVKGLLTKYNKD